MGRPKRRSAAELARLAAFAPDARARQRAVIASGMQPGRELVVRLEDRRVVYGRVLESQPEAVVLLPFGCGDPVRIERASIRHADVAVLETWALYRAICARQRRGVFEPPSAADDAPAIRDE